MNCPKCGTLFRNTEKGYIVEGILHRNVMCDKNRGGCGFDHWYHKPVSETGKNKIIETVGESRKGRMRACVIGTHEVTPCTCDGAEPHPNYLNEHRMIPKCEKCGNHRLIRTYNRGDQ